MRKYYFILVLAIGAALFYVFLQDPCNNMLRADFSNKYPDYKMLDSGSGEGSPESVQCHIYYSKPDSKQVYEDIWLYQDSGSGWKLSKVLETKKAVQTP
jgi:hypothetical protein